MTKKSVVCIEPAGSESNVFENYMRLPLMGTLYLGTILHNEGYEVRILNENILSKRIDPYEIKADVFCISVLTVSANRGLRLALELKRINPRARVIIGGIHASLHPDTFEGAADQIVYGEAEGIIVDLVEGRIPGRIVTGRPVEDLDRLPLVNYSLLQGRSSMETIPIMTSRGCPFDCNFCTVTKIFGRKFRMQSPERIIREVRHALKYFRTRSVFFYDDNFTANRERVREVCRLLDEEDLGIQWITQVRSDIARDPELLRRMERAGCRYFFIGFESIDDNALKAMHKSQTRGDIEKAIEVIRGRGINIHGMFMFGEDHDTPESIQATVDFALSRHIDTVQFMVLTPFPGTRFYEDVESAGRLIHRRWEYFNGMYAVFRPARMSPTRLQREAVKAYERFYSWRRVASDALRLTVSMAVDALTWNFDRVYSYGFDVVVLKGGARFLVGRAARTFDSYLDFLARAEERHLLEERPAEDV